jgi:hypothetical protein
MLTDEQLRLREPFDVTGSFMPPLCEGNGARINRQFRERTGLSVEPIKENWPMKFGSFLEPFVLDYHEEATGQKITRRGEVVAHPQRPNVGVTLDGYREADNWIIQVKCCGDWQSLAHIVNYYTCQAFLEAECTGAAGASLLIVHGGGEPTEYPIHVDDAYRAAVWARVDAFLDCVANLVEPYPTVINPIVPPEKWRRISLDVDDPDNMPNWGVEMQALLHAWDQTIDPAKENIAIVKSIKELLPEDVGRVVYGAKIIARSRNGAVTIKRASAEN